MRTARNRKPPPDGFEDIEDTLLEFSNKMKDAENASHEGKKRQEVLWPIFQISHQSECCFRPCNALPAHCDLGTDAHISLLKGPATSMNCIMKRKLSQSNSTTGYLRTAMRMEI